MFDSPTSNCVYISERQWLGNVPADIVHQYDKSFRYADHDEPKVAAWFEESRCELHGEVSMNWRTVEPKNIDKVISAIEMNCDAGCHCLCHNEK